MRQGWLPYNGSLPNMYGVVRGDESTTGGAESNIFIVRRAESTIGRKQEMPKMQHR